jgi:hypothetical protein
MKLPAQLYFLKPGWWLLHIGSICVVFGAGFALSQHLLHAHGGPAPHNTHALTHHEPTIPDTNHANTTQGASTPHNNHASHGEHTSPQVLRPLMRQLLSDAVQLQGALAADDLVRAATHADAIAGSCGDDEGAHHEALPHRLGAAFVEHDQALHMHAQQLSAALRAGQHINARRINQEMISDCQSCHQQAPAAKNIDLSALRFFVDHGQK